MSFRGVCSVVILFSSDVVQSGVTVCDNIWLHVSMFGLMVVISAYNNLGGGGVDSGICILIGGDTW